MIDLTTRAQRMGYAISIKRENVIKGLKQAAVIFGQAALILAFVYPFVLMFSGLD